MLYRTDCTTFQNNILKCISLLEPNIMTKYLDFGHLDISSIEHVKKEERNQTDFILFLK